MVLQSIRVWNTVYSYPESPARQPEDFSCRASSGMLTLGKSFEFGGPEFELKAERQRTGVACQAYIGNTN